jgi:hypothetical protein
MADNDNGQDNAKGNDPVLTLGTIVCVAFIVIVLLAKSLPFLVRRSAIESTRPATRYSPETHPEVYREVRDNIRAWERENPREAWEQWNAAERLYRER